MKAPMRGEQGQAFPEYLMAVALVVTLTAIFVVALMPVFIELVVLVVNHTAVYLSSVS